MAHPNEHRIRSAHAALAAHDAEAAAGLIADDAVVHLPGASRFAGDYRGREAILALFSALAAETGGSLELSIHDVLANDGPDPARIPFGHAVALLGASATRNGSSLDAMGAAIMHFREDMAVEAWILPVDQAGFDTFWSGSTPPAALQPLSERGRRGY